MSDAYSKTEGLGKPENCDDEVAVKAFFMYMHKHISAESAFFLPQWFVDARKKFTFKECSKLYEEMR